MSDRYVRFTLTGTVTEMGAEYVLDAGQRFTGMTFVRHGESYLVGLPVECLRALPLYGEVTITVRAGERPPRPPPAVDARDAARYRFLREQSSFNRDAVRLEWYLPRFSVGRDRVRGEPLPTLGERLDENIDGEIEQLARASRQAGTDLGFDDEDDDGDSE